MDTPGLHQPRTKRDPEENKKNQKLYRQRQYAALNGIEDVKAVLRRRYHERMARMRANGEYEAFKAKKTQEGMRRYHAMSEEQRSEVKRKNAQCQRNWMQKMKEKGTYEAYKQRLNARRREIQAEKKRALGIDGWKALQSQRPTRSTRSTLSLKRTGCKPFVPRRWSKWTHTCKNKNELIKTCVLCNGTRLSFL